MGIPVNLRLEKIPFEARGDNVLLRMVKREKTLAGVGLADGSAESKRFFVVSIGDWVNEHSSTDSNDFICIGDEVIIGSFSRVGDGFALIQVPGYLDLFIAKNENVFLKFKKEEE